MKKYTTLLLSLFIAGISFGQVKNDTTIVITISLDQYRGLLYSIDQNIDSKKTSSDILSFIQKNAKILDRDLINKKQQNSIKLDKPKN